MRKKTPQRNYRKEYDTYHASPVQKKNRAARNKANAVAKKKGLIKKGDGREVDHIRALAKGGSKGTGNTRVVARSKNRAGGGAISKRGVRRNYGQGRRG